MTNPQKRKGDRAELEVQAILQDHLGMGRRALGAGRTDDIGDITGIPDLTISVKAYKDTARAINEALTDLPRQQENAGTAYGCAFIRRKGGRYIVVMEPDTFLELYREAAL